MKTTLEPSRESKIEVAPGFSETRRRMLRRPASIAAVILDRAGTGLADVFIPDESTSQPNAESQLDWSAFLKECGPVARELHRNSSAPGQEAYLHPRGRVERSNGLSTQRDAIREVLWSPGVRVDPHFAADASWATFTQRANTPRIRSSRSFAFGVLCTNVSRCRR